MGFSVRLAPGIRVSASSRGVRTSIGPRIARVHVGAGRTTFSTGSGPFTYWTGGGGRSRSHNGTAAAQRQLVAAQRTAEKQQQAEALRTALLAILTLQQQDFPPAQQPFAPPCPSVDAQPFRSRHVAEAKASTSVFDRAARKAALAEAERRTELDVRQATAEMEQQRTTYQGQLDEWWHAMLVDHPGTVLHALSAAFQDNDAAAAAVGLVEDEVTLVVVVPPVSDVPERKPDRTPAGNLTLKKLTKSELNDFYRLLVCGHVLVTVKEAFAVAPALTSARIVAVRASDRDAYGKRHAEALFAGRFERARLQGIRWNDADATRIVSDAGSELTIKLRGSAREMMPLDLLAEPEIAQVLGAIDIDEMA